MASLCRDYNNSPEVIRSAVLMYVRYPLSLRNVEDLLFERGIDVCHETIWQWWGWFGPVFAGEIRKRRARFYRGYVQWRWHLDTAFVPIDGETRYLWRAARGESEALEALRLSWRVLDGEQRARLRAAIRSTSPAARAAGYPGLPDSLG